MAAPLLSSGCAVNVPDFQVYSPIPEGLGCTSDWFLHSQQEILTQNQCTELQESWINDGDAIECIRSSSIGAIKKAIEQLCSEAKCDYQSKQAIINALDKMQKMGKLP